ncbi:hypothetical protein [uncultured Roseobacter sp.]|uniref:hypothetical protein n=1 Tax=uncultured Roseobacter sp. TaxID=114847 RepID=UPI00262C3E63|nr:hypothetical protein [uncultured Roseobacter sp.]
MYVQGLFQTVSASVSIGWYGAGWDRMMSETASLVKDIVSPDGPVSITDDNRGRSADIDGDTRVGGIPVLRPEGDDAIEMHDEFGHREQCGTEQAYLVCTLGESTHLTLHMNDAARSLTICLAADESMRTGRSVSLIEPDQ